MTSEPTDFDSDLVRVGSIPANNEVIDAALTLVVKLAEETVGGAHGVSVSLDRHGKLRTVAASNDTVLEMDQHQYDSGEGPCVDAAAEGHEFHIDSLAGETRWPTFVPKATAQGIKSILSTPLIPHDRPLGALNIYSDAERAFGSTAKELAQLFATQAETFLAVAGADVSDEQRAGRVPRPHCALARSSPSPQECSWNTTAPPRTKPPPLFEKVPAPKAWPCANTHPTSWRQREGTAAIR